METKFTPGPLAFGFNTVTAEPTRALGGKFKGSTYRLRIEVTGENVRHDAPMIFAAPELYEALDGWVRYLDVQSAGSAAEEERLLGAMRAALAKARGETA